MVVMEKLCLELHLRTQDMHYVHTFQKNEPQAAPGSFASMLGLVANNETGLSVCCYV